MSHLMAGEGASKYVYVGVANKCQPDVVLLVL